jgi:hypothetical protein
MEIWKASQVLSGYEVSSEGRIRSVDRLVIRVNNAPIRCKGRLLDPKPGNHGYKLVYPKRDSRKHPVLIHRLIAHEFVPNPHDLPVVNHKDGNKSNNHPSNLEWCTQQQNLAHAKSMGLRRVERAVLAMGEGAGFWYPSAMQASRHLGVSRPCISAALNGKQATAGKFRWEFAT